MPHNLFPVETGHFHYYYVMKESLGLEKITTVSKTLAESSNFGEDKTEL